MKPTLEDICKLPKYIKENIHHFLLDTGDETATVGVWDNRGSKSLTTSLEKAGYLQADLFRLTEKGVETVKAFRKYAEQLQCGIHISKRPETLKPTSVGLRLNDFDEPMGGTYPTDRGIFWTDTCFFILSPVPKDWPDKVVGNRFPDYLSVNNGELIRLVGFSTDRYMDNPYIHFYCTEVNECREVIQTVDAKYFDEVMRHYPEGDWRIGHKGCLVRVVDGNIVAGISPINCWMRSINSERLLREDEEINGKF